MGAAGGQARRRRPARSWRGCAAGRASVEQVSAPAFSGAAEAAVSTGQGQERTLRAQPPASSSRRSGHVWAGQPVEPGGWRGLADAQDSPGRRDGRPARRQPRGAEVRRRFQGGKWPRPGRQASRDIVRAGGARPLDVRARKLKRSLPPLQQQWGGIKANQSVPAEGPPRDHLTSSDTAACRAGLDADETGAGHVVPGT